MRKIYKNSIPDMFSYYFISIIKLYFPMSKKCSGGYDFYWGQIHTLFNFIILTALLENKVDCALSFCTVRNWISWTKCFGSYTVVRVETRNPNFYFMDMLHCQYRKQTC